MDTVVETSMLDLILVQLGILFLMAGANERINEFISKQVELRLKYKLSSAAIQFISVITGIVLCLSTGVVLIPVSLDVGLNTYANQVLAGGVIGLGSGFLHDSIGLITELKDYFKVGNAATIEAKGLKRSGKF